MPHEKLDILLVEDNIHDVQFVRQAADIYGLGLKMLRLIDGAEAIDYLSGTGRYEGRDLDDTPRMILTDLMMPKVDGYRLLQFIRSDQAIRYIPVVVMTTSSSETDISRSYELGANGFLVKSMDIGVYVDRLIKLFSYWLQVNVCKGDAHRDELARGFL